MGKEIKRMRYFDGLFLNAQDYTLDQEYQCRLQRLHNRYLHKWGIMTGLDVAPDTSGPMKIKVNEGLALNKVEIPVGDGTETESVSQEILIYKNHPDNPLDLSTYMAHENIYIFICYEEVMEIPVTNDEIEKGQGKEIHVLERGRIKHSKQIPTDPWRNIILARVVPKLVGTKKVIEEDCIFYTDPSGNDLRTYAGPEGNELALEKLILKNRNTSTGPCIQAVKQGVNETGIEINSEYTSITGSVDIKGDLVIHGQFTIEDGSSPGKQSELLVSNSRVQVNSPGEGTWSAKDGGFEVFRGGTGENDARLVWSESEKVWKAGYGSTLNNIAYGPLWERLIKNGFNDDLHRHKKLCSPKGDALVVDDSGNLSVAGDLAMNDKTLWLRTPGDTNHGLGWFGVGKQFAEVNVDGPALFGYAGGLLGTTLGGQKAALSWNNLGNVGIGTANPKDDKLDVAGTLCILSDTNPIRFTPAWSGFSLYNGAALNHAEISNDTSVYKALMIVGNRSAGGPERRVAVWDRLDVNGFMYVAGSMQVSQALTPSAGTGNNGIIFPADPGGGGGDSASIKYYPRSGEACTLEIKVSNDPDDNISLMASGNVGIGTTSPADKLDVSGWTRIMTGSNPIRFTSQWSGFPDMGYNNFAEICNDTTYYKTLMIVGNRSADKNVRRVSVWDRLEVNGFLYVNGNMQTTGYIMPSVGNSESNGIMFPKDPYGGTGDAAWIRYYSDTSRGGGENMTLEIGISNDSSWNYYGGDRMVLYASGGVYVNGYMYVSSSRDYKENINDLSTQKAKQIVDGLNPVTFNFKGDADKVVMGFIAEEVPAEVAAHDQKAISPVEIIAALTGVVKDQRKAITKLQKQIEVLV